MTRRIVIARLRGVDAVIDKDLIAALLVQQAAVDRFC